MKLDDLFDYVALGVALFVVGYIVVVVVFGAGL